jgi:NAD(P)-dependent dehydrogenase (short-subunit alcohol dehydrogenase family)
MRFRERVAIITGGGSGIGRAAACLMAAEGGKLALVDLDPGAMSPVSQTIEAAGGTVASITADVLDEGAVERMVQTVLSRFGRVDILVNGVGGSTIIERSGAPV